MIQNLLVGISGCVWCSSCAECMLQKGKMCGGEKMEIINSVFDLSFKSFMDSVFWSKAFKSCEKIISCEISFRLVLLLYKDRETFNLSDKEQSGRSFSLKSFRKLFEYHLLLWYLGWSRLCIRCII